MKKALLLALAALAVSAAQAVTYTWTTSEGTGAKADGALSYAPNGNNASYRYLSFSLNSSATNSMASGTILSATVDQVVLTSITISERANGNYVPAYISIVDSEGNVVATSSSTTYDVAYTTTVTGSTNTASSLATVFTFDTNGATLPILSVSETYTIYAYTSDGTLTDVGCSVVASTDSGSDWYASMSISTMDITDVPEPTCLALLALGVAGLALRRRA